MTSKKNELTKRQTAKKNELTKRQTSKITLERGEYTNYDRLAQSVIQDGMVALLEGRIDLKVAAELNNGLGKVSKSYMGKIARDALLYQTAGIVPKQIPFYEDE